MFTIRWSLMASEKQTVTAEFVASLAVVERLFEAADGGRTVHLDEFGASTILAMLQDPMFAESVISAFSDIEPKSAAAATNQ